MSRVGALSECPFQGDESIHSAGNGLGGFWGHLCGPWHKEVGGRQHRGMFLAHCSHTGGSYSAAHVLTRSDHVR